MTQYKIDSNRLSYYPYVGVYYVYEYMYIIGILPPTIQSMYVGTGGPPEKVFNICIHNMLQQYKTSPVENTSNSHLTIYFRKFLKIM